MKVVTIGDLAPDVGFLSSAGAPSKISDYRGKALILYFYPKDDTPGCTTEAQTFSTMSDAFAAAGAVIVGVSKDSEKSHAKFIAKYDLKVELGADVDGALCEAFGVWVEKSMYGRNYMGIERATFLIDADGKVAQVWRKVKVKGHAEAVLEAVRAL